MNETVRQLPCGDFEIVDRPQPVDLAPSGRYAVVTGPDCDGSLAHNKGSWAVIKAYHPEQDLYTVRTVTQGVWVMVPPACLTIAAGPIGEQVVS